MATLAHVSIFLFSAAVIWFFAGILIESVDAVARRFHKTGFSVAFFVLGFLTSISEISVAVNSAIEGVPQVSAGNLIGASFVILLFIIPVLAVAGNGIGLKKIISGKSLLIVLAVIALPSLVIVDGNVTRAEGLLALLVYITLIFAIYRQYDSIEQALEIPEEMIGHGRKTFYDIILILLGGATIFIAAHYLVEQAVYFSKLLSVPPSIIGLILLSVGTNVPELVIAGRSLLKKQKEIAFGDYLGSAAANTLIFGLLVLINGGFSVEPNAFISAMLLTIAGLACLYFFARSKNTISRKEGLALLLFYASFLIIQLANVIIIAEL